MTNIKFLLILGAVLIIVGIATGIFPVAVAGIGPWFLAACHIRNQRRERKR